VIVQNQMQNQMQSQCDSLVAHWLTLTRCLLPLLFDVARLMNEVLFQQEIQRWTRQVLSLALTSDRHSLVLFQPALPGPALPGPALPGPALPGPALPGPALPLQMLLWFLQAISSYERRQVDGADPGNQGRRADPGNQDPAEDEQMVEQHHLVARWHWSVLQRVQTQELLDLAG